MFAGWQHRGRIVSVAVAIACVMELRSGAATAQTMSGLEPVTPPAIRSNDRDLLSVIGRGLARSATLRGLNAHIERAQVVVYLYRVQLPPETRARTQLIGAAHGWRYLAIELDWRLTTVDLLAILGHELQHAVEIADAPEVIDNASLASLYRRIGARVSCLVSPVLAFETTRAIETGQRVYDELFRGGW